jgi:hypothetical protein
MSQAAIHHQESPNPLIEYHIILSPIYRVPVLYFFLHNLPDGTVSGPETAYNLLVPEQFRATIKEMGVMGGISMSVGQACGKQKRFAPEAD